MTGSATGEYEQRGLCLRTSEYLFDQIRNIKDSVCSIQLSILEIYNENLHDLLHIPTITSTTTTTTTTSIKPLTIVDTPSGVTVPSLYMLPVSSAEEASSLLFEANLNR